MFTKVQKNYYVFSALKGAYIFIYIGAVLATRFKFKSLAAVAFFIRTKIILSLFLAQLSPFPVRFSGSYYLFAAWNFFLSPWYFSLSYKKKFVTKFVTCITKFVICVSKFVTSVTNLLTNFFCADSKKLLEDREKFQGERKKLLGDAKEISQARIDFKQGHPTHRPYINMYAPFCAENT